MESAAVENTEPTNQVIENEPEETEAVKSFFDRAESMGLTILDYGIYEYKDIHSSVMYRTLQTLDNIEIPYIAVFSTVDINKSEYCQTGIVSDKYQFVGNEVLNRTIRESIGKVEEAIFVENPMTDDCGCYMSNEMVIRNMKNVPSIGDVYPHILILNSYNGTRAASTTFGISVFNEARGSLYKSLSFNFKKFGMIRQVHTNTSKVKLSADIGEYVNVFSGNIVDMIEENSKTPISEQAMLKALDTIEKIGKRRRIGVSTILEESKKENVPQTRWDMFQAITKFSAIEKNINVKLLLDDIAEKVLIIPVEIHDMMKKIGTKK